MTRLAKESLLGRGGSPGLEPRGLEPSKHRGRANSHHRVQNEAPAPAGWPPYCHVVRWGRITGHAPAAFGCRGSKPPIGGSRRRMIEETLGLVPAFKNAPASEA